MLQRLPIALAEVNADNTSENLLHEIHQAVYSLFQENRITKIVHNNIMSSKSYKTKWIIYLWVLKTVKHLIFIECYWISQIK